MGSHKPEKFLAQSNINVKRYFYKKERYNMSAMSWNQVQGHCFHFPQYVNILFAHNFGMAKGYDIALKQMRIVPHENKKCSTPFIAPKQDISSSTSTGVSISVL